MLGNYIEAAVTYMLDSALSEKNKLYGVIELSVNSLTQRSFCSFKTSVCSVFMRKDGRIQFDQRNRTDSNRNILLE